MKFSQKIILYTLSLALTVLSLDAAKRRSPGDDPARGRRGTQAPELSLDALCRNAYAQLHAQFPDLSSASASSRVPQIIAEQLSALHAAAGVLRLVTPTATRRASRRFALFDRLADDAIGAMCSIVLPDSRADAIRAGVPQAELPDSRHDTRLLQEAIDGYNDARDRQEVTVRITADTSEVRRVPRIRDIGIVNDEGAAPMPQEDRDRLDALIPDLLCLGPCVTGGVEAASTEDLAAIVTAVTDAKTCSICLEPLEPAFSPECNPTLNLTGELPGNLVVTLHCKQENENYGKSSTELAFFKAFHPYHRGCLVNQCKPIVEAGGIPPCAICRAPIDPIPPLLKGEDGVPAIEPANLLFTGVENGSIDYVQRAIDLDANVINARKPNNPEDNSYDGCTALHLAIHLGHMEIAMSLLDRGADITAQNNSGLSAIHWAAIFSDANFLQQLITRFDTIGIDARNLKSLRGELPLHFAALNGNIENVGVLLSTDNLHINTLNSNYETPLQFAFHENKHDCIVLLRNKGGKTYYELYKEYKSTFLDTIQVGTITEIQALAPQLNHFQKSDREEVVSNALIVAEKRGNFGIISYLTSLSYFITQG